MDLRALAQRGLPVLCLDTCSILDIMRDPTRDTMRPHEARAALDVIAAAEAGLIACLVARQVEIEFRDHDQAIQDETTGAIEKLRSRTLRTVEFSGVFGRAVNLSLDHLDDYAVRARSAIERLLQVAIMVEPAPDAHAKAFARVNAARAPARRGKDSSKDCLVYETYIEVVAALRREGLAGPIVLVSSNTTEYRQGGAVHPDIEAEFAPIGLSYQPNMAAAKHALGLNVRP